VGDRAEVLERWLPESSVTPDGDPDTTLDLQAVLATVYDRAGYDLQIGYTRDLVPPPSDEWADWADQLMKAKGLRTG
jgi:Protein of unknown function (DUF4058)